MIKFLIRCVRPDRKLRYEYQYTARFDWHVSWKVMPFVEFMEKYGGYHDH